MVGYWCNSCQATGPNHYGRYEWNSRADRIEELEAENRLLRDAVYIDDRTVTMQANDRSKAMTAIRRALDFLNADMPTEAKTALRTTLAELTSSEAAYGELDENSVCRNFRRTAKGGKDE